MAGPSNANSPRHRAVSRNDHCRTVIRAVVFVLCLLGGSRVADALDPARLVSQYAHTAWRLQDGELPASAYPIAQSKDGYLWIGTQAGVVRFDGVRFVPLDKLGAEPLPDRFVVSLLGARDGSLWIGTRKGLSRWDHGHLTTYPDLNRAAFSISEDQRGEIWFLTQPEDGKSLCQATGTRIACRGREDGLVLPEPCCGPYMSTDGQGTFWISTFNEVVRWREGTHSEAFPIEAKIRGGIPSNVISAIEPTGALLVGVAAPGPGLGLQRIVSGQWQPFVAGELDGSTLAVQALLHDRHGVIWVGTIDHGIYRVHGDRVDHFDSKDGLSSDCIYYLFEDGAGSVWVATSKGIDRFRDLRVASFTTREGLSVDEVDSVLAARDGKIWIGTALALDTLEHGRVRAIGSSQGLPGSQVTALLEDDAGRLWVGADNTLSIYSDGKFTAVPGRDGKPLGFVRALTQDAQRDIWATLRTNPLKLVRIRDGKVAEEFAEPVVPPVTALAADPREGIWLGLRGGDLAHLRPNGMETFATRPGAAVVRQVAVAADGTVYAASDNGLIVLSGGVTRVLDAKRGLPCDAVHGFVRDERDALWLQLECGLAKIEPVEIERALREPGYAMSIEVLDVFDGVRKGLAPFNRAARAPDGTLWFANGVSLQTLDPRTTGAAATPPVLIEQLIADRKSHPFSAQLTLPALTRDVQIDYTALDLAVPQRLRFRYRLEGHDEEWTEAQGRRQAFYTDLAPGEYRFRVAASAGAGAWSEAPASLQLTILPAFYQTGWFRLLVAVAIAAALWKTFAWRLGQARAHVRARLEERHTERERIARELHDTFLQAVQGLMLRFQSAMERIPPSQPARELMERALDQADLVLAEGRDRVTQLRTLQHARDDLPIVLRVAGEDLARDRNVAFRLTVEGVPRELEPGVSDEVQRIACEALANAFHHARATQIDVDVTYARKLLSVSVVDDGQGFDVGAVAQRAPPGHWGLTGMQERAAKIRARLEVSSGPGIGTAVQLTVPAAIAFRRSSRRWRRWLKVWRADMDGQVDNA